MAVPQIKRKISSFLSKEDGKISRESIIKAGIILGAAAAASLGSVSAQQDPVNFECTPDFDAENPIIEVEDTHKITTHTSHSQHGSHSSHGSCGSLAW